MDFNINNETFAKAYNCLNDANILLGSGLGNFNELDESALLLINKQNIDNNSKLNSMIEECQELKVKMYSTIKYLSEINVESADYFDSVLGDIRDYISLSDGTFTYLIDLDYILENYANGKNLTVSNGLASFYKEKNESYAKGVAVIEEQLREIWENGDLTIRERIVNGSLKHIQLGIDVGRKPAYKFAGTRGDGSADYKVSVHSATTGIDCNAKVSFDIFNVVGDECDIGWLSVPEFYDDAGVEIPVSEWERAQPADIFVRRDPDGPGGESRHVGLIVRNNSSDMSFDVVEARGPGYGIVARTISYDDMEKNGFIVKDMGSLYGE